MNERPQHKDGVDQDRHDAIPEHFKNKLVVNVLIVAVDRRKAIGCIHTAANDQFLQRNLSEKLYELRISSPSRSSIGAAI